MIYSEIKNLPGEDISILLKFDNHAGNYLCECGFASGLSVKDCLDIHAVFVSHTHIDHWIHFDHVLRCQISLPRTVVVCGPPGMAGYVQAKCRGYCWNLVSGGSANICYEIREIHPDKIKVATIRSPEWEFEDFREMPSGVVYENDTFSVKYTTLDHGTPSIAYLFSEHDKVNIEVPKAFPPGPWIRELKKIYLQGPYDAEIRIGGAMHAANSLFYLLQKTPGYRLGVIMDHHASPENHDKIVRTFGAADKVFIEAFYKAEDAEFATANRHSTSVHSGTVLRKAQVKEAVPVHFSRRYTAEDREILLREFAAAFAG